jgi:hypothetical protein
MDVFNPSHGLFVANISTIINTRLKITIKIAQSYLINVKLEPAFDIRELTYGSSFETPVHIALC